MKTYSLLRKESTSWSFLVGWLVVGWFCGSLVGCLVGWVGGWVFCFLLFGLVFGWFGLVCVLVFGWFGLFVSLVTSFFVPNDSLNTSSSLHFVSLPNIIMVPVSCYSFTEGQLWQFAICLRL